MRLIGLALVACLGVGCIGYNYTPTTRNAAAVKPPGCEFELLTTRPPRPYVELGVLERSMRVAGSASDFKESVRENVCNAGGDAVLTELNGLGGYIRGTVLKYQDQQGEQLAPFPGSPPAVASPSAPPAPPADGRVPATVVASAQLRSAPFAVAPVVTVLAPGQSLSVAPTSSNGWRSAKLTDGRGGYVQDAQIKVDASAP
jgi:hypothetical protein